MAPCVDGSVPRDVGLENRRARLPSCDLLFHHANTLHRISALLKTHEHPAIQRPHV